MAKRCPDCNVYMRKVRDLDGEGWLCTNCGLDDPMDGDVLRHTKEILEALDRTRGDTGALAFGLAQEVAGTTAASGIAPRTVAAICVYLASIAAREKLTQTEIADVSDVGQVTIRNNYRTIYDASGWAEEFGEIEGGEISRDEEASDEIDLDEWESHVHAENSRNAAKASTSDVRRFAMWYEGGGDPTAEDVDDWLGYLASEGFAPATIERRYGTVRQYFEWAGLGELTKDDVNFEDHIAAAWQARLEAA